ncbi:transposase [Dictyobacter formicarum]|uniref:Transposase n=2 Tax=Dictyobacter formicarum TaxID=2778368 RepID=A0ABQ3V965_9CHLR|nr:ISL3 family transposase [Dictyobacter formicarum]GHO82432.1 transposase [Dictyobacter formicarum]GHO89505.1 transposase [Dictyobacter formicarum]
MMEEASLLSLPEGMRVEQIQITEHGLVIAVEASHPTSCCPLCTQSSDSIKTHYRRTLRDAPCVGRQVQLILTVRKFYCRNPYCSQKVFTERLPSFVEPWARMTIRCCQHITSIGLATCGKGGARLAARLGIPTTRPTILRRIMALPDISGSSVVYLGIDDFSLRRGYRFGTILVNLESHRVVDLLPDRRAETAARWMYQQPDLAVISRDRGGEYASAAREGAPQAIQCADRFHVVKNLTEAVQVLLARCQAEILTEKKPDEPSQDEQNKPFISIEEWRPKIPAHIERVQRARRSERSARYEQAVELNRLGKPPQEIARILGVTGRTIQRWLKADTFPDAKRRRRRPGSFEIYASYVLSRWQAGERNGLAIYREIKEQGYDGSERTVYRYLEPLKQAEVRASIDVHRLQKWTANTAIWLFVRDPEKLDEIEREDLAAFCEASAPLKKAYDLLQDFLSMVHKREGQRLDAWLVRVAESELPELQSFAAGVEKDKDAVQAGLTWAINNGMVEGHVTKLKLIKRTMYGRAGFALLRQRVLHAV